MLARALRGGRITPAEHAILQTRIAADVNDDGPILLLSCDQQRLLSRTASIVTQYAVRTLDAIHLGVADLVGREVASPEPLVFISRDSAQAAAASALGFLTA